MKELEHNEQSALIKWWSFACKMFHIPEQALFAIPNGGFRAMSVAVKLKAEGVRSGVPDLFLAYPNAGKSGLWIEMKKANGGKASENQKSMMAMLCSHGYSVAVCHGWIAAKKCIEEYLSWKNEDTKMYQ